MSKFWDEVSIIPKAAWAVELGMFLLLAGVLLFRNVSGGLGLQEIFVVVMVFPVLFGAHILLTGYVYADAKRRGMGYVLWSLIAFWAGWVGFILYFLLRDPMPSQCRSCGTDINIKMLYCPVCGAANQDLCTGCGKKIEPNWANCANCGIKLAHDTGSMQQVK